MGGGSEEGEGELISNGDPYYTLFLPERTFVPRFRDFRCARVRWNRGGGKRGEKWKERGTYLNF